MSNAMIAIYSNRSIIKPVKQFEPLSGRAILIDLLGHCICEWRLVRALCSIVQSEIHLFTIFAAVAMIYVNSPNLKESPVAAIN